MSKRLDLRSSNKHFLHQNLSIYYTWKNIRQQPKSNKLKIIAPTWNDEFELPDGSKSVSVIQDYITLSLKKMKYYLLILLIIFTSIALIMISVPNKRQI